MSDQDLRGLAAYDQARHPALAPHHHLECAHVPGDTLKSKRFRAVDGRLYLATEATCRKCGERIEKCLLVPPLVTK